MPVYALTILIGAFLLFQVQPVIARIILPWFGGSAAVWTTCLLFFQVALLLGYLYAHALIRYLRPRAQMLVHVSLLLASALVLPIYPGLGWRPVRPDDPTWRILALLAVTVGGPYFLLSSTGPLLQAWYARRFEDAMPYRLYALSNAGSMFALVSYPALFEPFLTTHQQAWLWSAAYSAFVLLCGFTAIRSGNSPAGERPAEAAAERPGLRLHLMWLLLPACASALLLAVTSHLSQNVAPIPLLWVLPLSAYLLSFIVCFEGRYRRKPYLRLLTAALASMCVALGVDVQGRVTVKIMVPLFVMGLFACCMVCHGELARLKPHPRYLTHFYVAISAGGALGGILVGIAAPHVFRASYELPLGLLACVVLVFAALRQDENLPWFRSWRQPAAMLAAALLLGMTAYLGFQIRRTQQGVRLMARNFYGCLSVRDSDAVRILAHGTIFHGEQFLAPSRRNSPTAYYGRLTGIGIAMLRKGAAGPLRVGVIGLGVGTLAAYGRPGDYYRFYEINPQVLEIAKSEFFFLRDCPAAVDVLIGDGRSSLEREAPQAFDILAVDAFSGDSIPVHLLTREALAAYFRHLKPDGILAMHLSNRYLDLQSVVAAGARAAGKQVSVVDNAPDDSRKVFAASWALISSPKAGEQPPRYNSPRAERPWTDDYSNLLRALK